MVEPISILATWGLTTTAKFVYSSVLAELNKDSNKAWVKDVLQDWLKDVAKDKLTGFSGTAWEKATKYFGQDSLEVAAETAITAFLLLVERHLAEDLELSAEKTARFEKPLNSFLKDTAVRQILGSPLQELDQPLDIKALRETWDDQGLRDLPDDFNWDKLGQDYRQIVRQVFNQSEELKPLLDFHRAEQDSKNLQNIAGVHPELDLVKYQETVLEKYGNLKLESLDSSGYIYDKELKIYQVFMPQKVRECQEYLPQVYELPKDLQQRLREQGELEREIQPQELERYKRAYTNQQTRSVLEVIEDNKYKYLVILGDPGSGKSTLLQYLAVEWAKLPAKDLPAHPLTILIELQKYIQDFTEKRCKNFLEYLHQGSNWICHLNQTELDTRLKQQPATILFDGLDEVFDPNLRASIIAQIHNFTQTYAAAKVIVTSRIIGYKPQQLKDAEFHHFMLQDLEPEQIQDFLKKWHDLTYNATTESQKKQDRQQRITKAVQDSPAIQQLAGNPLLLTMMAILNRNQDLPRDRAKLYERSSELLLYQWDVEAKLLEEPELKGVDIDYSDKQAMLREVAHFMQATKQGLTGNLISHQDLRQILTNYLKTIDVSPPRKVAKLMIEQLRTRNFILCDVGGGYYAFVHRTFLEYFCAWSYIYQLEAQSLSIEQIKTEVFGNHWQDESWHEVLRLIAGMILDLLKVGEIIEYLMAQEGKSDNYNNLFLAADCLEEVRNRKAISLVANKLLEKLKQLIQTIKSDSHKLLKAWSFEILKPRIDLLDKSFSRIATTWYDHPNTLSFIQHAAQDDDDNDVRRTAIQELAQGWKEHAETLPIIQHAAQDDDDSNVRRTAIQELAQGWKEHAETLLIIQQLAQANDSDYIRSTAVEQLAQGWKEHAETLPIIQHAAQDDDDNYVRITAIQELAQGWKEHAETLPIIQHAAQADDSDYIRITAVEQLAQGWKEHAETLPIIQHAAQSDDDNDVRSTAIQELIKGWKEHAETLPIIQHAAQSDDDNDVRSTAIEQLAQGWKEHAETLPIIQYAAQADDDNDVRSTAIEQLAQGWKEHPHTFELLINCAVKDTFVRGEDIVSEYEINPCQTALEMIVEHFPNHSQTKELLIDRANNDRDKQVREFAQQALKEL